MTQKDSTKQLIQNVQTGHIYLMKNHLRNKLSDEIFNQAYKTL